MKVCLRSRSDGRGGGYAAAYRLHRSLLEIGSSSTMLVGEKKRDDRSVVTGGTKWSKVWGRLAPRLSSLPLHFYRDRETLPYSIQWLPDNLVAQVKRLKPSILNLHWICGGYLRIETVAQFGMPLVWTLHDMWAFTGGCHYSQECLSYKHSCGSCPQLHSRNEWDLSRWVWRRKAKALKTVDLTVVTPSRWLSQCAASSSLLGQQRIETIPHGIDIERYKPVDRCFAREILNLPQDKRLVMFGATMATSDPRKGFHLLQPALQILGQWGWQEAIELVIFGASAPEQAIDLGFTIHYLGRMNDDTSLVLAYSATDVMVVPSLQEAFGLTALEALSCGTPVVAFDATGVKDIIQSGEDGYLAEPYKVRDLAKGIAWVLEDDSRYQKLCDRARAKVEQEFTSELQAKRYFDLFTEILERRNVNRSII